MEQKFTIVKKESGDYYDGFRYHSDDRRSSSSIQEEKIKSYDIVFYYLDQESLMNDLGLFTLSVDADKDVINNYWKVVKKTSYIGTPPMFNVGGCHMMWNTNEEGNREFYTFLKINDDATIDVANHCGETYRCRIENHKRVMGMYPSMKDSVISDYPEEMNAIIQFFKTEQIF